MDYHLEDFLELGNIKPIRKALKESLINKDSEVCGFFYFKDNFLDYDFMLIENQDKYDPNHFVMRSKEFSKGFRKTTNNRMELLAVIEALKKLTVKNLRVHIYTDSKYVVEAVEKKWVFKWEKTKLKRVESDTCNTQMCLPKHMERLG